MWSSAGPSGVTTDRKGRKHVLPEMTGSVPRRHHTPPAAAQTCHWLGSGFSVYSVSASLLGLRLSHQGPAVKVFSIHKALLPTPIPKTLPAVPYPTAVFKPTSVFPTPLLQAGSGPAPHSQPENF